MTDLEASGVDKADIDLRTYLRTLLKGGIDTIAKVIKLIPPLPHPISEHKLPVLDLIQVRRIGGKYRSSPPTA